MSPVERRELRCRRCRTTELGFPTRRPRRCENSDSHNLNLPGSPDRTPATQAWGPRGPRRPVRNGSAAGWWRRAAHHSESSLGDDAACHVESELVQFIGAVTPTDQLPMAGKYQLRAQPDHLHGAVGAPVEDSNRSVFEVLNHRGRHVVTCMLFDCMDVHPLLTVQARRITKARASPPLPQRRPAGVPNASRVTSPSAPAPLAGTDASW